MGVMGGCLLSVAGAVPRPLACTLSFICCRGLLIRRYVPVVATSLIGLLYCGWGLRTLLQLGMFSLRGLCALRRGGLSDRRGSIWTMHALAATPAAVRETDPSASSLSFSAFSCLCLPPLCLSPQNGDRIRTTLFAL